jgi:tRNA(Leu) C34 or U34 (ribose-2'-O)-methylase TrmL
MITFSVRSSRFAAPQVFVVTVGNVFHLCAFFGRRIRFPQPPPFSISSHDLRKTVEIDQLLETDSRRVRNLNKFFLTSYRAVFIHQIPVAPSPRLPSVIIVY